MSSVAVTGLGAVSALGIGVDRLWSGVCAGRSGIGALTRFVIDEAGFLAAQVPELPELTRELPVTHRLAVAAAREAARDAGVTAPAERVAVVLGTTTGGIDASERWYLGTRAGASPPAAMIEHHCASTVTSAVRDAIGARGVRQTISTACSSGANAIITGADLLAHGLADVVFAGGADALCSLTLLGFSSLGLVSSAACRPFDRRRDGLTLGEAGAFVVLERADDARRRGARVHGYFVGGAVSCDAFHITAPEPSGRAVVAAMREALHRAGVGAPDVAYVNAHGTGTLQNDRTEANALRQLFGARAPPVSSTKSLIGHTLGAAGAIEAIVTILAVRDGVLPPTMGTTEPDADAPPDLVLGEARAADVPLALSSSFAFGGNNAVLIFARTPR